MEAYRYADGQPDDNGDLPPPPAEYIDLQYIDRFGVQAVYGRSVLAFREMRRMIYVENIIVHTRARKQAENWSKWAQEHPEADAMLNEIVLLCQ